MKHVLLFTGSNSPKSINRNLVKYAAKFFSDVKTSFLDLRKYELPIYSLEIEENEGIPENAYKLRAEILTFDAFVVSIPENNGSVPAFLKNGLDWISRCDDDYRVFKEKPVLLISTSPSPGGGERAVAHAEAIFKTLAARVYNGFSLPRYYNVTNGNGTNFEIIEEESKRLEHNIQEFEKILLTMN